MSDNECPNCRDRDQAIAALRAKIQAGDAQWADDLRKLEALRAENEELRKCLELEKQVFRNREAEIARLLAENERQQTARAALGDV